MNLWINKNEQDIDTVHVQLKQQFWIQLSILVGWHPLLRYLWSDKRETDKCDLQHHQISLLSIQTFPRLVCPLPYILDLHYSIVTMAIDKNIKEQKEWAINFSRSGEPWIGRIDKGNKLCSIKSTPILEPHLTASLWTESGRRNKQQRQQHQQQQIISMDGQAITA